MGFLSSMLCALFVVPLLVNGDPLVPTLCIFGDPVVDAGNNNLQTLIKANFLHGRDFVTRTPTGRFCNGKLATDFTAGFLGFSSYPPAYLSQEARGRNILNGVNFASAASGYYDNTAQLYQLANYKEWQRTVVNLVGKNNASATFSGGIHLLSAGSSDFIQNYYINPILNKVYTTDQFSNILMNSYASFIQDSSTRGKLAAGRALLKHPFCAMKDRSGHVQMQHNIYSGMDSTLQKLLTKSWPKVYSNKDLI
ncbi:GDSL esterase/lipase-like [Dorcoceras hygrometricum]|uniref:GDSL esterase/lipase-like n=1 Tax=Dorcoceras hygrometricum TaxID=472368 RepID=A0A2Z7BXI9_9LAMI|nr:GDSL esterase/lipase-like [Dorcoceras hygrometricum]